MSPDEKKIQERKIRLMKIAMVGALLFGLAVLRYLEQIAANTQP